MEMLDCLSKLQSEGWVTSGNSGFYSSILTELRRSGELEKGKDFRLAKNDVQKGGRPVVFAYRPESLSRAVAPSVPYKGPRSHKTHLLHTTPPRDGISITSASRIFNASNEAIWRLIDANKLRAGLGPDKEGRTCVLVSKSGYKRCVDDRDGVVALKMPADAETITNLERTLAKDYGTLCAWCKWSPHPILGRQIKSGIGEFTIKREGGSKQPLRTRWASRNDVEQILNAVKNPIGRRFPGNPGIWIADGVFQHDDGSLYLTDRYVYANKHIYGVPFMGLGRYRKRLTTLQLVWPGSGNDAKNRWTRKAHSKQSLDSIVERRSGKADGGWWMVAGDIWSDREGLWYSSRFISKHLLIHIEKIHNMFRRSGKLTKFKHVPNGTETGGSASVVHHQSEAHPLLGIGGGTVNGAKAHKKPAREKHLLWKEWYAGGARAGGMSFQSVAQRWNDENPDDICTSDAVKQGIRRAS